MGKGGRGFKLYPVPGVSLPLLTASLDWWSTWFGRLEAAVASGSMTVLRKSLISLAGSLAASCWPCSLGFWHRVKVGVQVRKQLLRNLLISLSGDSRRWQGRTFPFIYCYSWDPFIPLYWASTCWSVSHSPTWRHWSWTYTPPCCFLRNWASEQKRDESWFLTKIFSILQGNWFLGDYKKIKILKIIVVKVTDSTDVFSKQF